MIREIISPTLQAQKITIRQDEGEKRDGYSDGTGRIYPTVRINDTILNPDDIDMFEMSSGIYRFTPSLLIQIEDPLYRFREQLKPKIDILTIYVGTNRDTFFVKSDYLIESVTSSPTSHYVLVKASMHVPVLRKTHIRSLGNLSSLDAIKKLCEECGLGLLTNTETVSDNQIWLQDGKSNLEMIEHISKRMWARDDTAFITFIDQWQYLCVIDLYKMFTDKSQLTLTEHPFTGEPLEKETNVYLSNHQYTEDLFKIGSWSPETRYASRSLNTPGSVKIHSISEIDKKSAPKSNQIWSMSDQLLGDANVQIVTNDNVHESYGNTMVLTPYNRSIYDQDELLNLELQNLFMSLYPSLYVPIKIYDTEKRKVYENQDEAITNDQLLQKADANASTDTDYDKNLNEQFTGNYALTEVTWKYFKNTHMLQTLKAIRIDEEKIDATDTNRSKEDYEKYVQEQGFNTETNTAEAMAMKSVTSETTFFEEIVQNGLFKKLSENQKGYFRLMFSKLKMKNISDYRYWAYMFGTAYHETARTMMPIDEIGKGAGREYGRPHPVTKLTYYGRGYVQLTWHELYSKFSKLLGIDLVNYPEKAKDRNVAADIQILGMTRGLYTGVSLKTYFTDEKSDWINARKIVNSLDRAELIAGISKKFYAALKKSDARI